MPIASSDNEYLSKFKTVPKKDLYKNNNNKV